MRDETEARWGAIFALWFAALCAAGQFAKVGVILPELGARWPGQGALLGLTVSVVGGMGIVFGTTAGLVVARAGARRLMIGALIAGGLISGVQALGLPFWAMLARRVVEGVAHLTVVVAGPVLIAGAAGPRHQAAAATLWSTYFGLAFTIVAIFGLPLVRAHGPEALWAVHGALTLVSAAVLAVVLPREVVLPAPPLRLGRLLADHLEIYRSPWLGAPAFGFIFYTLIFVAIVTVTPGLVPPESRGTTAALMPLLSILVSMSLGVQISRRLSAVLCAQLGFAGGAAAALLWAFATGPLAVLAACAMAASLGLSQGASFAAVPELNRSAEDRARASGALAQMGSLGNTLGTPILVTLIEAQGRGALTAFVLPVCLGGIAMHLWQANRRARAPR